jgi:hypothetical protein
MADVDLLVTNTVNASWRHAIDAATLAGCLAGRTPAGRWSEHVRTFFEDVPREAMLRFIAAHRLPPRAVLATYRALLSGAPRHDDLEAWLVELAGAA